MSLFRCFNAEKVTSPTNQSSARPCPRVRSPPENHETSAELSKRFFFSSSIHESRWSGEDWCVLQLRHTGKTFCPIATDDSVSNTTGERFMVKEESAASVGTRPWTPEGRSLTLSIAFML
ncbi:hypothetical protein AVEN_253105-1 [Araneus ventricosus]|uniref:Uncharacterized protein n=1 Tax=Araneus ventricosus TaxID=182803 RepID=A0A4Y2TWS2_ARAVE|nr:hypothetical protein AVEN_253105-1 [Araneus ventricosus]